MHMLGREAGVFRASLTAAMGDDRADRPAAGHYRLAVDL
jgi:hypothetical protein